jgi:hypothetical protein
VFGTFPESAFAAFANLRVQFVKVQWRFSLWLMLDSHTTLKAFYGN